MKPWLAALAALACLALGAAAVHARQARAIAPQDRQAILDLIARYSHVVDSYDADGWLTLFAPDGVFIARLGERVIATLETPAELRAFAEQRKRDLADKGIQSRHYQTNTLLDRASDGTVTGTTLYFVAWQRKGQPAPEPVHTGVYKDVFRKTRDGWTFARRDAHTDHE